MILNKAQFRINNDKTPYELWYHKHVIVNHFRVFGRKCYIKKIDEKLNKFDARADEGIFIGCSHNSKGYMWYDKNTRRIVDFIYVKVNEHIDIVDNEPLNIISNNLVNNDKKDEKPFLDEYIEEPLSPQSKDPTRYV